MKTKTEWLTKTGWVDTQPEKFTAHQEHKYDNAGRLTTRLRTDYDNNGWRTTCTEYGYDSEGRLISSRIYGYDSEGQPTLRVTKYLV